GRDRWSRPTLRKLLSNPVYQGDRAFNRRQTGKRCRGRADGEVIEKQPHEPRYVKNAREAWVVTEQAYEPLIGREDFARAQAILAGKPHQGTSPLRPWFLFSKLCVCGCCGGTMYGETEKTTGRRVSICGTYRELGKTACRRNVIHEDRL